MPKMLWAAAAQLAQVHGVGTTSKQLALNPDRLKQHTSSKCASARRRSLPTPSTSSAAVRVIEVAPIHIAGADRLRATAQQANPSAVLTAPNGVSLTVYQQLDAEGIAALIRAVTEGHACSR